MFVHGNGDSGALWINNIWRFEANGYKRTQLYAIDFTNPSALRDDSKPEPNRSSTADAMKDLAAFVTQVRNSTRRRKVALVASSRGGNTVRNYLKNGGGAEFVSHAVLCGTPNKGIVISDTMLVGSEFNGAAPFLKNLNSGPNDLIAEVELMAIRSDKNDKYSQPDGRFIGQPGKPTGVSYDSSELRGAKNVILDGVDHRETAFHKLAFAAQFAFITGKPAATLFIAQEPLPTLNGRVTGIAGGLYTNLPVADAEVEIYEIDAKTAERKNAKPVHKKVTGSDGVWGPVRRSLRRVLRVRAQHGGPAHHPHLSLALPALERCGASASRALRQGRRDGRFGGDHEPPARLFRRRPRQVHARRQSAARHHRRRARRFDRPARLRRRAAHRDGGVQQ